MAIYQDLFTSAYTWFDASYGASITSYYENRANEWHDRLESTAYFDGYEGTSAWPTLEQNQVNGLSAIASPSGAFLQSDVWEYASGLKSFTLFIVANVPVGGCLAQCIIGSTGEEEWNSYRLVSADIESVYDSGTSTYRKAVVVGGKRLYTDSVQTLLEWNESTGPSLYVIQYDWEHATLSVGVNGSFASRGGGYQTAGLTPSSSTVSCNPLIIAQENTSNSGASTLCEIIPVRDLVLSEADRQVIEGDLAHKWGISLVVSHPYYSSPPAQTADPIAVFAGMGASGAVRLVHVGTGSAALAGIGASGTAVNVGQGAGLAAFSGIGASGIAGIVWEASGSVSLAGLGASGESLHVLQDAGNAALSGVGVAGECITIVIDRGSASFKGIGVSGECVNIPLVATGGAALGGIGASSESHRVFVDSGLSALAGLGMSGSCRLVSMCTGSARLAGLAAMGNEHITTLLAQGKAGMAGMDASGECIPARISYGNISLSGLSASGSIKIPTLFDGILDFDRDNQGSGPFADAPPADVEDFERDNPSSAPLEEYQDEIDELMFAHSSCS